MWRPTCQQDKDNDASAVYDCVISNGLEVTERSSTFRHLWVWIHASAFTAGYDALKLACQKEVSMLSLAHIRALYSKFIR